MLGSIIGDIVGSRFEFKPTKSRQFKLFTKDSRFTDDTVLTMATLDAIVNKKSYGECYYTWGNLYPGHGYGGKFREWLSVPFEYTHPYNSYGNGSAMRISPIGYIYNTVEEVLAEATNSAIVTHNHPEGIKGAQAAALCVFLARTGSSKQEIKKNIEDLFGYNLNRKYISIKRKYKFDVSCQGSVPESIICFLESKNYEDCIRKAVSLGGDADTIAAIAGGIAEAYYGVIPLYMIRQARKILPDSIWSRVIKYGLDYHIKSIDNFKTKYLNLQSNVQ